MTDLRTRLGEVRKDKELLRHQIDMLEAKESLLLELVGEKKPARLETRRAPRSNVKRTVIDLLTQVKGNGINATMAVAMADDQFNVKLERGTVSSLLSRMKNEGLVIYHDGLYRLVEHSPDGSGTSRVASVHPLRASGDAL